MKKEIISLIVINMDRHSTPVWNEVCSILWERKFKSDNFYIAILKNQFTGEIWEDKGKL